jgi:hypothetical protein
MSTAAPAPHPDETAQQPPSPPAATKPDPPTKNETVPKKRGRKSSLDDKKRDELCVMIHVGCSVRSAATLLGIKEQSVRHARRTNPEFNEQVRKAERQRNLLLLQNVAAAGKKSWRASAWLLASLQPETYNHRRPGRPLSKRHLAEQIATVLKKVLPKCLDELDTDDFREPYREAAALPAVAAIDARLAEIEAQVGMPIDELIKEDPVERRCFEEFVREEKIDSNAITKNIEKLKNRLAKKYGLQPKSKSAAN